MPKDRRNESQRFRFNEDIEVAIDYEMRKNIDKAFFSVRMQKARTQTP